MKYIESEKLIAEIERLKERAQSERVLHPQTILSEKNYLLIQDYNSLLKFIDSLQQEQPDDKLTNIAYWLEYFGMPKENIENCITQISQGYGAIRYLEGVQHGAEAVNELAQQDQPEVDLEKEIKNYLATKCAGDDEPSVSEIARHFYELGKRMKQKPAEWSNEDTNALLFLHELISFGYTERFFDAQTAEDMRRWLDERLKSHRPQPRKEQPEGDCSEKPNNLDGKEETK